jgi:ubiquinone/menaquinone biosynthesis C-methylase UbiE
MNKYSKMQNDQYDNDAKNWSITNKDPVVGSFDLHNSWKDYDDFLFKDINTSGKLALDFGCGPGRNIVKFSEKFNQIDGVDISNINLENAKLWCKANNKPIPTLYKNDGSDLKEIPSNIYDVVFSTICLQHICVHEIRFSLLKEFFRVLKSGGNLCIQMGFGVGRRNSVDYYVNHYDSDGTNGHQDVRVTDPNQLKDDLDKIGFIEFNYDIRPVGPGDEHTNWIFFRSKKP